MSHFLYCLLFLWIWASLVGWGRALAADRIRCLTLCICSFSNGFGFPSGLVLLAGGSSPFVLLVSPMVFAFPSELVLSGLLVFRMVLALLSGLVPSATGSPHPASHTLLVFNCLCIPQWVGALRWRLSASGVHFLYC